MVEKMKEKGRGFGQYDNLEEGGKDRQAGRRENQVDAAVGKRVVNRSGEGRNGRNDYSEERAGKRGKVVTKESRTRGRSGIGWGKY